MIDPSLKEALIQHFQTQLEVERSYARINIARHEAESIFKTPIEPGHPLTKVVDEAMEAAVVRTAPHLVAQAQTTHEAYDRLVELLGQQPILSVRSTTSILQQAYSTPIPLAYLASNLAGITQKTTVYEPTVGNGALVIDANPANVIANEINSDRLQEVSKRGFRLLTQHDATEYCPEVSVDVVIANPPFGSIRDVPGKRKWFPIPGNRRGTNQIDHAIAMKALGALHDDGKAVLILGGKKGKKESWRSDQYNEIVPAGFFYALYHQYNVVDHFSVWGDLYAKQGAGFPIDIVVIHGRGESSRDLPAVDVPRIYTSFETLKELIPDVSLSRQPRGISGVSVNLDSSAAVGEWAIPGALSDHAAGGRNEANHLPRSDEVTGRVLDSGLRSGLGAAASRASIGPLPETDSTVGRSSTDATVLDVVSPVGRNAGLEHRPDNEPDAAATGLPGIPNHHYSRNPREPSASTGRSDPRTLAEQSHSSLEDSQTMPEVDVAPQEELLVPTPIASRGVSLGTLTPKNLATPAQVALDRLKHEVGDVDEFVRQRMGYSSVEEMWGSGGERLCAEQVDAIAMAFYQRDRGKTFVNEDQTGNGKGRWCAAQIIDAMQQGDFAIWVVQQADMYTSALRDLEALGFSELKVFLTDTNARIPAPDGSLLRTGSLAQQAEEMQKIISGEVKYDIILTTYSQLQPVGGKSTERRKFLKAIAPSATIVLDEAHNACGSTIGANNDKARSLFVRGLVDSAKSCVFASATAAKTPEVIDLYARRTDVADVMPIGTLVDALIQHGTPLQQVYASASTAAGHKMRRERSYDGVTFGSVVLNSNREVADVFSQCMGAIARFDIEKADAVEALNERLRKEAKAIFGDTSIGETGASSTNFTSLMHNITSQFSLCLKADEVANLAISACEKGQKPFIGFVNTMESHLQRYIDENHIAPGEHLEITFADLLLHNLYRSRDVIERNHEGHRERRPLGNDELGTHGTRTFEEAERLILDSAKSLSAVPISFVDHVLYRLKDAGYVAGEITGRSLQVDYNGVFPTYSNRPQSAKNSKARVEVVDGFNNGSVDVLLANSAGFTGISVHASKLFDDQRQRLFILAQIPDDIIDAIQAFGRVNRFGQTVKPEILVVANDLPSERRPVALLADRMSKLNANTSADTESSVSAIATSHFFSRYGEYAASAILREYREYEKKLAYPSSNIPDGELAYIRRVTGRIPLMSLSDQEDLYTLMDTEVENLIKQDRALGIDPFGADFVDLDANVLARVELAPPKKLGNPFGAAVYAEVVDAKASMQPMTQLEVLNAVRDSLGLPSADHYSPDNWAEIRSHAEHWSQGKVGDVNLAYEKELSKVEMSPRRENQAEARVRLGRQKSHLTNTIQALPPGTPVEVDLPFMGVTSGVVLNIYRQHGGDNPIVLHKWNVDIALKEQFRVLTVSSNNLNRSGFHKIEVASALDEPERAEAIYAEFDIGEQGLRQERVILRGNLLSAVEQYPGGQIAYYSTHDGTRQYGMIMPSQFDLEKAIEDIPVNFYSTGTIKDFLTDWTDGKGIVCTEKHELEIHSSKKHPGTIVLKAFPENGGAKFARNPELVELIGEDFYSVGNSRMEALVPVERVDAVIHYLLDKSSSIRASNLKETAREHLGQRSPELEWLEAKVEQDMHLEINVPLEAPWQQTLNLTTPEVEIWEPQHHPSDSSLPEVEHIGEQGSTVSIAPSKEQTKLAEKRIARLLQEAGLSEIVMQGESFHLEAKNGSYTPLSIERHQQSLYFTHYLEDQFGDLFIDSEIVFKVSPTGLLNLYETATQNPLAGGELRNCDRSFAGVFTQNLLDANFASAIQRAWEKQLPSNPIAPATPVSGEVDKYLFVEYAGGRFVYLEPQEMSDVRKILGNPDSATVETQLREMFEQLRLVPPTHVSDLVVALMLPKQNILQDKGDASPFVEEAVSAEISAITEPEQAFPQQGEPDLGLAVASDGQPLTDLLNVGVPQATVDRLIQLGKQPADFICELAYGFEAWTPEAKEIFVSSIAVSAPEDFIDALTNRVLDAQQKSSLGLPETLANLELQCQAVSGIPAVIAPPIDEPCCPSLQEMRNWKIDAILTGKDEVHIARINQLGRTMLEGTEQKQLPGEKRDPNFRNPNLLLQPEDYASMQLDKLDSISLRTPERGQLLEWYKLLRTEEQAGRTPVISSETIKQWGQQQIAGTPQEFRSSKERDREFRNPSFVLSYSDYQRVTDAVVEVATRHHAKTSSSQVAM